MTESLTLTEAECNLLLDLLRAEAEELPTETRRTGQHKYREELHQRSEMVRGLIEKLLTAASTH